MAISGIYIKAAVFWNWNMEIKRVPIDSLVIDSTNPRSHNEKNLSVIKGSLQLFGQAEPLVVQKNTQKIIGGNGRVLVMKELGWTECDVVEVDLNATQAVALGIALNRTSELAEWDSEVLEAQLSALKEEDWGIEELAKIGFDAADLTAIEMGSFFPESESTGGNSDKEQVVEDEAPEPPKEAITKPGDLWLLGDHRLLCGDSTKPEDVARLMAGEKAVLMNTDPPYGIDYIQLKKGIPGSGFRFSNDVVDADIENDTFASDDQLQAFLEAAIRTAVPHLTENTAFYLWHPMLTQGTFFAAAADILIHRQIIWVKPGFVLTRSGMYHWKHELCFYGWRRGHVPPWYGIKSQVSVWPIGRDSDHANHPTQKPVELFAIPMRNHSQKGEICYEPFAGSGSQFIAGEQLGRRVYGLEIEPRYCDVIVARWEKLTGKKATLGVISAAP